LYILCNNNLYITRNDKWHFNHAKLHVTEFRHATNSCMKRLVDVSNTEITRRYPRDVDSGKLQKVVAQWPLDIQGNYRDVSSYSVRRREERREEEEEEEEENGLYLFGQREGRPSDSIRYKKGRRTPSARMRKVMSRKITGRRRKEEYIGIVRPTERGRIPDWR